MIKRLQARILAHNFVVRLIAFSKRLVLPGFRGMPLFDVASFFIKGLQQSSLTTRASALSYNFFLALFPFVIFLFTLIPYIPIDNFQNELMEMIKQLMPKNAYEAIEATLEDIVKNQHSGLLSIGFVSAMYFSSNGFMALINAFNSSYHTKESRSALKKRLTSLLLVIISIVLLTLAITLIIGSEVVLSKIINKDSWEFMLLHIGRWLISLGLVICMISFNYLFGPSHRTGWQFFSPGSVVASVLIIALSLGFAYYINNFGNYNKLYGSIGTLMVIMVWLYLNSLVLLIGFELNASIFSAKSNKK